MNTTDFMALAGVKWLMEEVREALLQRLYYSLPEDDQKRIMLEVLTDLKKKNKGCECGGQKREVAE